jgi:hypothetical protein
MAFSFSSGSGQPVNHASDEFDASQKILDANVLVWTMRI